MKYTIFLFALICLLTPRASAQDSQPRPLQVTSPEATVASEPAKMFASVTLVPAASLPELSEGVPSGSDPSPRPQAAVQSVYHSYSFQAYLGYTFVRFYAFPGREVNRNGLDLSMSYFFKKGLLGVEGALTGTFGSIANETSDFLLAAGGPRVRWSGPRGLELWAHGLLGDAHFGPRLANLTQDGLAYELGGGVDISAHSQRIAYRLEADMIGSRLYHTTQYSPKVSAGIVFKF
jgi:hypothetical protein